MAKLTQEPRVELKCVLTLDEGEVRALDALAGYGDDAFIKVFYKELGESYMKPHEAGLRSFLAALRRDLPSILERVNAARKVFNNIS